MKTSALKICDKFTLAVRIVIVLDSATAEDARDLTFEEDSFECFTKFRIENAIDNWIECRVRVAEPRENFECCFTDTGLTEGRHDVHAEEWHPADCVCERRKLKLLAKAQKKRRKTFHIHKS